MTPYQMAQAECANLQSDGTCLWIEPSSWHDYRVDLPESLNAEMWAELVAEARKRGQRMISIDRDTGQRLDLSKPHANRRRLDLYWCSGCGCRVGVVGELCPSCRAPFFAKPKEGKGHKPRCSKCGEIVKNCSPEAVSVVCWRCSPKAAGVLPCSAGMIPDDVDQRCLVARGKRCGYFEECILPLADAQSPDAKPGLNKRRIQARQTYMDRHNLAGGSKGRACPDCGAPVSRRRRYCDSCRKRRRRTSYRRRRDNG